MFVCTHTLYASKEKLFLHFFFFDFFGWFVARKSQYLGGHKNWSVWAFSLSQEKKLLNL